MHQRIDTKSMLAGLAMGLLGLLLFSCGHEEEYNFSRAERDAANARNAEYDRQLFEVMKRTLKDGGCGVDVGTYKGEMLEQMAECSPEGTHYGFEPLPDFAAELRAKFTSPRIKVYELALGEEAGEMEFTHVITNPAYSGFKERSYVKKEKTEKIKVKVDTLDHVLPPDARVDLIKIDVEGAEILVMRGARETIKRTHPVIVFEYGKGSSDHYGATPDKVWGLLHDELGLKVSLMGRYLKGEEPFTKEGFANDYENGPDFYYIAYP